jgi:hypothetical protein
MNMSKMTQRRMNRRASRKLNTLRRENRRQNVELGALSDNLKSAFKAIEAQRNTIRELKGQTPAPTAAQ